MVNAGCCCTTIKRHNQTKVQKEDTLQSYKASTIHQNPCEIPVGATIRLKYIDQHTLFSPGFFAYAIKNL